MLGSVIPTTIITLSKVVGQSVKKDTGPSDSRSAYLIVVVLLGQMALKRQ